MFKKAYLCFYVIIFIIPLFLFFLFPIRGTKEQSKIESRNLVKVPSFSFKTFGEGIFQDKLEDAISDQLLFSQSIKIINKKIDNISNSIVSRYVKKAKDECNIYVEVSSGYYTYGCSDYLIEKPSKDDYKYDFSNTNIKKILDRISIEKYIYFIEKDRSIIFNNMDGKNDVYKDLKESIYADGYGKFSINSYKEYEKLFFQTDHHWNYLGSYKGYKEIASLLGIDDSSILKPIGEVTYDVIFYGSSDRKLQTKYSKEKFKVYEFEDLEYTTYINGVKKEYSNKKEYNVDNYKDDIYTNHYARYYGTDYAEVVFDYENPEKENLLVLCTSYSNAIKDLLASHFNKTYYIDLRHYSNFNIENYIENHSIDKVLLIGDITSFIGGGE